MGLDPLGLDLQCYSVPEVADELSKQTGPSYRLSLSTSSGKLKIDTPTTTSLREVSESAKMLGDHPVLSQTDTSILALAVDLKRNGDDPIIVSDDYAIQNVAEGLSIAYQSLASFGIRQKYTWIFYCPACQRRSYSDTRDCQVCGTRLKRRPGVRKQTVMREND